MDASGPGPSDADSPPCAGGDPLARVRALGPRIAAAADEIDRTCRLPEPLVEALVEAGLFRLLLPRSLDGEEIDPVTFVRVIEAVAKIDASTAWVLCQLSGCSMVAAYLRPDVAAHIFGDRRAMLAWGPGPESRAVAVDGGYRVTGTWSFASGGRHATWLGGYCTVHEVDGTPRRRPDGTPDARTMLFPAASASMTDVWDVIGLRGTGSDTYSVADLFVPHEHSLVRDEQGERRHPGLLYCFPTVGLFAAGFAGVALGLARATLDAFVDLARAKTPRGLKRTLRDSPVVQAQVAQGEARLRSARLFLLASLADIWRAVGRTGNLTLEHRVLIRLAGTHAIHEASAVVDAAYHAAGATAIFTRGPFERRFRDMHAVAQQLQGRAAHLETVGQFLLGLEPDTTFL
jgi:alkylation response protein AidB-like acyl-CoA dehydrogenase